MKHLLQTIGFLVVLFASCRVGFSLGKWHNCSTDTCEKFFTSFLCAAGSPCQCGVTTKESTCSIVSSVIEKQTKISFNVNQSHLSCCMCKSNKTFCCNSCQVKTTMPTATTTTAATTTIPQSVESSRTSTPKKVAPIHTNVKPLIYSAIGVFSLIALCIIWQCVKQTYLLRKKKFTDINSNRVNTKKRKIQEAMSNLDSSEKDTQSQRGRFDMTHNKIQQVDNETLTRQYDWTTPAYLPNMLAPAYTTTEHVQHSPPRLMLDDDDSDIDKKSIGKTSVINVDEETDEDLKEILESEDDDDVFKERTNTQQSYTSRKKSVLMSNQRKSSTTSKRSKSSNSRDTSADNTTKIPNPAIGKIRKCSYSGPGGRERTPSLGFGNLKSNRITPVSNERKPSVSSIKTQKKSSSDC